MTRALAILAFVASYTVACGRAPAPQSAATTAMPQAAPEPTTIEEAEQQVQSAKRALAQPVADAAPQSAEATGSTSDRTAAKEPEECRALRSLERATQALCRLAGPDDPRCKDAAQALEQSRRRVNCR